MTTHDTLQRPTMRGRDDARGGGVRRLLLLALGFALIAALLSLVAERRLADPAALAVLGGLAGIGVFFLFATALRFVTFGTDRGDAALAGDLLNHLDTAVLVTDADDRVRYVNKGYEELIGVPHGAEVPSIEGLLSRRVEASEAIYRLTNDARAGKRRTEEVRIVGSLRAGRDGPCWLRLQVQPLPKGGVLWHVSDITGERGRQERAFQDLQNAINYLDHAPAGFLSTGRNGEVAYLNATLADWLGVDLASLKPGQLQLADIVEGDVSASLAAARQGEGGTAVLDVDMRRRDGGTLPVRFYHRLAEVGDGSPGTSRTVVINRLGPEAQETAIQAAEARFTRTFNNIPVAVASLNGEGRIMRTNAPFHTLFGTTLSADSRPRSLFDLVSEPTGALTTAWDAALAGGRATRPVDVALPGPEKRNLRLYLTSVADPARSQAGPLDERVIACALDMTEQRALEQQVMQSEKMRSVGDLAGHVAHDFNNVLMVIKGVADLLLERHTRTDPSYADIMQIRQSADLAASLTRQLLAYSRAQTLLPEKVQLNDLLADLRVMLSQITGERIELKLEYGRDLWPVLVDEPHFKHVIINLVRNSRDAMSDGGRVTIRTSNAPADIIGAYADRAEAVTGDHVLLEVEDTGSGIPKEIQAKIFEPFFTTKERFSGTGLGLSTVDGTIKQMGGFIHLDSEVGRGTTFRIFLPRHIPVAAPEPRVPLIEARAARRKPVDVTGGATILLVEDEDSVRRFAVRALTTRGYVVHEAASGLEALDIMERVGEEIDLVVSDVMMPEMDGHKLYLELRQNWPDLRYIFMSGYTEGSFSKEFSDSAVRKFRFLPKPVDLKQLVTNVKEVLAE